MKSILIIVGFLALAPLARGATPDSLYIILGPRSVEMWNTGVAANCASAFRVIATVQHDTLVIDEIDTSLVRARCMCTFDLEAKIYGLAGGTYTAIVRRLYLKAYGYRADTVIEVGRRRITVPTGDAGVLATDPWQSPCHGSVSHSPENEATALRLSQNYPNPFNPSTTVRYSLPGHTRVRLIVYDVLGRAVATLVDGERGPGEHTATFEAATMCSGTYVIRLSTDVRSASIVAHLVK